ncbi:calcium-binding protein [Geminicoccus harenae]|uniref:hypothetical protein n=1 Tax=Geminicoccus harenae TaxID=2498453 RepID=UPI00168BE42F|nr:hypothetical protein [Geminicoccus harenae]
MGQIKVHQYTDGPTGHVNVTLIKNGVNLGTYGQNKNYQNSGVMLENGMPGNRPGITVTFTVPDADVQRGYNYANTAAIRTSQGQGEYYILGSNCIDFVQDVLIKSNTGVFLGNHTIEGTLVDWYADEAPWLKEKYWDQHSTIVNSWDEFYQKKVEKVDEAIRKYDGSKFEEELKEIIDDFRAESVLSPIAVDLDGDGLETVSISDSQVEFDLAGDGIQRKVGWLTGDDGFIVIDRDGDGSIVDVSEMFGGANRGEGFGELAALDTNGDGKLDAADSEFTNIAVWQDANENGVTDAGELHTLASLGITQISLDYVSEDTWSNGNLIGEVASATKDGGSVLVADIYFRFDSTAQHIGDRLVAVGDRTPIANQQIMDNPSVTTLDSNGHEGVFVTGTSDADIVDLDEINLIGIHTVKGFDGDDQIVGSDGNEIIVGGFGADILTGGAGQDTFQFSRLYDSDDERGVDTITDFDRFEGDKIDVGQAFAEFSSSPAVFIGSQMFDESEPQIRSFIRSDGKTEVQGNLIGGEVEFRLVLSSSVTLASSDFIVA